jgi:hypothetical protein
MKVMLVAASTVGFRVVQHNKHRFRALEQLIDRAVAEQCSLIVLPAGYWARSKAYEVDEVVLKVRKLLVDTGISLIGGVDLVSMNEVEDHPEWLANRTLPSFGFAIDESGEIRGPWRQATRHAHDYWAARLLDVQSRTIKVAGKRVLTLICGEMANRHFRRSLDGAELNLVVAIAHSDMGGRVVVLPLEAVVRKARCPVVHTQHMDKTRYAYICRPGKKRERLDTEKDWDEDIGTAGFWVAWKIDWLDHIQGRTL